MAVPRFRVLSALLLASACSSLQAQVLTVGAGPDCSSNSIQAAVNAAVDGYTIRVANNASWTAQAIVVSNKDLAIVGGFANCSATAPSGLTTLSGQGGANDSVVTIRGGSNVTLENLSIIRGDEVSDGYGGGVDYRGTGNLVLRNTALAQNYAGYGGGMSVISEGGQVVVELRTGAVVQLNTAQFSGGGIRIEGDVRLLMLEPETIILSNEARGIDPGNNQPLYGNGGGLQVIAPARADIGSPGLGATGPIANNTARYGGGIAIDGSESTDQAAYVRVFTTDSARPTRIQGNRATQTGGGVHLLPTYSGLVDNRQSKGYLCVWDARIEGNKAQNGSAVYGDSTSTLGVTVSSDFIVNWQNGAGICAQRPSDRGAVTCATPPCTVVAGNRSVNALDQPTGGAAVLLQNQAFFVLRDMVFARNEGGDLVRLIEPFASRVEQILATDNVLTGSVLRIDDGVGDYSLVDTTIANNTMGSAAVLAIDAGFRLERSLVWQPGRTVVSRTGGLAVADVIANETASLLGGPEAIVAPPRFTDPTHGDYLPIAASPAVDFATGTTTPARDIFGATREVELPVHADFRGMRDVGAIERQEVGNLVLNPDFPARGDTPPDVFRLWTQTAGPASVAWSSTQGAPGAPGAVFVSYQPPTTATNLPEGGPPAYAGLRQCVLLPGPGVYALSGWSLVPGNGQNRDYARLHWVLRNASADCTGAIAAEGDHFLPRSGTWSRSVPVEIPLQPAAWTIDSSLEVTMEILDGDVVGTNLVDAYFDRIELRVLSLEVDDLLADGFE